MKLSSLRILLAALVALTFVAGDLVIEPSTTGHAAEAQKKKKKRKKKKAKKKAPAAEQEARATAGAAVPPKEKPEEEERTGPASISDISRVRPEDMTMEAKADAARQEAIDRLKEIIPKIKDPGQKADLHFQLAELWWEKSKYVYFREMEDWDKKYDEWLKKVNAGQDKLPEPKQNHRESELYRAQAIKLYEDIIESFPGYGRSDEVLFNLAYNMYETDRKKEGVALYWDLIKKYPTSRFVPDAYLQMGEHYFNTNNVFNAQKAYQKAHEVGDDRIKLFATYKLAWCDFNLGEYGSALEKFQGVVTTTERIAGRSNIQLKSEALRDMILTFTMLDMVEPAIAYYEQHSDDAGKWVGRLADAFYANGKNEEAISTYRYLIERDPNNANAPEYQATIVRAVAKLEDREAVLLEMERLVEVYGPSGPWANANRDNERALTQAYKLTEGTQRELVTEYHQEAQKTKYAETYRLAAEIYRRYLENFSDSEHAYRLRYYYSEILYTLNEFELAADQYLKVVDADPDGEFTLTSAYNALLCYEKLAAIDRGDLTVEELTGKQKIDPEKEKGKATRTQILAKAKKDDKAEEIPRWEVKQIEASDAYVRVLDDWLAKNSSALSKKKKKELSDDEIVVRYKAAFLYYDHRHYDEAAARFEHIILKWPSDPWAVKAADLILDSLNTKEQWAQLNDLSRKFRANNRLVKSGGKDFRERIDRLVEGSAFMVVFEINQEKDKKREASEKFIAFVDEFPESKYADTALYNAIVYYDSVGELDKGISIADRLFAYEDTELQPRVVEFLGTFHERIADYESAAKYYRMYADRYGSPKSKYVKKLTQGRSGDAEEKLAKEIADEVEKKAPDMLFNAGLWYEGLGEFDAAIAAYSEYVDTYEKRDDVPDIRYNIALIHERRGHWNKAAEAFEAYLKKHQRKLPGWKVYRAKYRISQAYVKMGKEKEALKEYEGLLKDYKKLSKEDQETPVVRDAVAHAAYVMLKPEYDEFLSVNLDTVKDKEIKKRLAAKTDGIASLEKKYAEVLAYGSGDWGICALTRIGLAYRDFSQNLFNAPIPPGLDFEQEELYRALLEEKAFPLEEKSIEALEKALAKSYELSVYNECTLEAQNILVKFKPNAYGKIHDVKYFGSEFFIDAPLIAELREEPVIVEPEPAPAPRPGVPGEAPPAEESTGAEDTVPGTREARR